MLSMPKDFGIYAVFDETLEDGEKATYYDLEIVSNPNEGEYGVYITDFPESVGTVDINEIDHILELMAELDGYVITLTEYVKNDDIEGLEKWAGVRKE